VLFEHGVIPAEIVEDAAIEDEKAGAGPTAHELICARLDFSLQAAPRRLKPELRTFLQSSAAPVSLPSVFSSALHIRLFSTVAG